MASTLTLQSVLDYVRTQTRMVPILGVGGFANEPGLSFCNDVLQTLLSAPYSWRFNKKILPSFTTIPYQQDYVLSGCTASVAGKAIVHLNSVTSSTPGLTETSTTVTATYSDFAPNGFAGVGGSLNFAPNDSVTIAFANQAGYNITTPITAVPNNTSFQFTAAGGLANDGGQGVTDMSWVEHATLQDYMSTGTVKPVHDVEVVATLPQESIIQPPMKMAFLSENNTLNTITIRAWPVPSAQIWNTFIYYQGKAPLKTDVSNTWSPWPDELGYVLRSGVKSKALDHAEDPRAMAQLQIWQQDILKALDIKDQEQRHESFFPDLPVLRGG